MPFCSAKLPGSADRLEAAATIFRDGDVDAAREQIERFSIDYILIGPAERRRYEIEGSREELLLQLADKVFAAGEFTILRTQRGRDRVTRR